MPKLTIVVEDAEEFVANYRAIQAIKGVKEHVSANESLLDDLGQEQAAYEENLVNAIVAIE